MALFFLLDRDRNQARTDVGALDSRRRALLPAAAAFGGMAFRRRSISSSIGRAMAAPAGASQWRPTSRSCSASSARSGTGRLNAGRVFITALAVVDDIGAIRDRRVLFVRFSLLFLARSPCSGRRHAGDEPIGRFGPMPILVAGIALWAVASESGVHPTIGGLDGRVCLLQDDEGTTSRGLSMRSNRGSRGRSCRCSRSPTRASRSAALPRWLTDRVALGVFPRARRRQADRDHDAALVRWASRSRSRRRGLTGHAQRDCSASRCWAASASRCRCSSPSSRVRRSGHGDAAKLGILAASAVAAISGFVLLRREPRGEPAGATIRTRLIFSPGSEIPGQAARRTSPSESEFDHRQS